ncbi:TMEM165/GDT1 family protein [Sphingomonas montanisoli]|uniref:GDT1 family protein n=1 Tax=Sphingomonas montanisoli TaxID=2606412 RepID=A0A5D9C5C4_9SPHN|nr:TMEM165/GDT1 family protein [Sphingomonas montanisoli]TZG26437.1 TMEM165/GDT1 family protein [Sphingomonas montanisoli]
MNVILASTLLVAFAEIGDKTMLLAIILAARFRAPWQIIAGIFAATIVNHALAAWAGAEIAGLLDGYWFRLAVAIGFLAMAAWTLVPDAMDDDANDKPARFGVFLTTTIAYFAAEMGDKTQIATIALGARYHAVSLVAIGTTLGMMIANVPAVFVGDRITRIIPLKWMRIAAALIFLALGILAIRDLLV